ncbi:MAG: alpha/beta fold hydrolase [Rhodospirillales bacterium]
MNELAQATQKVDLQPKAASAAIPPQPTAGGPAARGALQRMGDRALLQSGRLENLDRMTNAALSRLTMGVSPVSLVMSWFDWAAHLAASPGKQFQLGQKMLDNILAWNIYALDQALDADTTPPVVPSRADQRFADEAWQRYPFNLISQGFLLTEDWWRQATTGVRGVSRHDEAAVSFAARQVLDTAAPSNVPVLNPEVLETTMKEGGANVLRGAAYVVEDARRLANGEKPAGAEAFQVGKNVAATPGKVVFRNRLMELIQYEPTTKTVQREPVLMQSAWMMKYYIMDLSPHDSLVKYLVDRGHTVFMISWLNPGSEDRDLGMEDYRRLGTMAAIDVISEIIPDQKIHAVGYCLGGILLTIAAATMGRDGDDRLASVTLFTTMTDFTEVGEISVFLDPSAVTFLEDMMWDRGYLDPRQAGGGFQILKSRDLIWSKMIREYFLGQREPMFDLMAWNADGTRMPYRQHSELLRRLYRDNELFEGKYPVGGRPIRISDIHVPIFSVAAEKDHVAPWHSVYKMGLQSDATEFIFVLTSGGHNVGIVNEPGHPHRSFRLTRWQEGDRAPDADTWYAATQPRQGSWWPAWQEWLTLRSSGETPARTDLGAAAKGLPPLCDAPGTYVFQQ